MFRGRWEHFSSHPGLTYPMNIITFIEFFLQLAKPLIYALPLKSRQVPLYGFKNGSKIDVIEQNLS